MAVKIARYAAHRFPVELSMVDGDTRYLTDSELADLYIALTDYYASPDNKEN